MKEIKTLTLEEIARRQARFAHLCKLFNVQDRPDSGDGYTAADWEANRQAQYDAEDRRMAQRGLA
jgi:hypothetical protein